MARRHPGIEGLQEGGLGQQCIVEIEVRIQMIVTYG